MRKGKPLTPEQAALLSVEVTTRRTDEGATVAPAPEPPAPREPLAIPGPAGARFVCHVLGAAGTAANAVGRQADIGVKVPEDYSGAEEALAPVVERYPWAVVAGLGAALALTLGVVWVGLAKLWKKAQPEPIDVQPVAASPAQRSGSWSPL